MLVLAIHAGSFTEGALLSATREEAGSAGAAGGSRSRSRRRDLLRGSGIGRRLRGEGLLLLGFFQLLQLCLERLQLILQLLDLRLGGCPIIALCEHGA